MRVTATFIGILALFLASCGLEPDTKLNKADLDALKGPDTGSIESSLKKQADQAESAGDFRRAAQVYKQLADKYPAKTEYEIDLAEALRRAGDNNASLRIADAVLHKEPGNAAALENKGLALMNTGEFTEAATTLGEVMKIDPKRWRTLNGIGILFAMKGKYDGAIAYFQEALGVSTDNASVLNNAALTYAIDRQYNNAYEAFARAKRHIDPGSPEMKPLDLNLALVYAVDGKLDEAEAVASPHLSKAALYNNMGFYSYLAKNNEAAKVYLNMALTQNPMYYERAWKNLGAMGDASAAAPSAGSEAVPLSDIPESRPLHSDASSPYAGTDEPVKKAASSKEEKKAAKKKAEQKKAAAKAKKDKKKVKPKKKETQEDQPKDEPTKDEPAKDKGDTSEKKPDDAKPAGDQGDAGSTPKVDAPGMNPDVIMLHKPMESPDADKPGDSGKQDLPLPPPAPPAPSN